MGDRFDSKIQADPRSPLKRFWDQEIMWRANALYHNDALNLPVKIVTGSRMDDDVTPGRVAAAALAFTPFGRITKASKITTLSMNPTAAGTARYFGGYGRNVPTSAEFASGAFTEAGVRVRELKNMVAPLAKSLSRESIKKSGVLSVPWNLWKTGARLNNYAGRAASGVLFGSRGLPAVEARIAAASKGTVANAGFWRGAADAVMSPVSFGYVAMYFANKGNRLESEAKTSKENLDAKERTEAREQFNQDVIEAVERRSDKNVLKDWLARKLTAYDAANKDRVKSAFSEAQRTRQKGDHSAESAEQRTIAALASVDAANMKNLMDGVDRGSDAWKALREDRERQLLASVEDQFVSKYGYDYSTAGAMRSGKDPAASARATKDLGEFLDEVRTRIPTNGVDEIRFMTGGWNGK